MICPHCKKEFLTFSDICEKEPAILGLYKKAIRHTDFSQHIDPTWSYEFKPTLYENVGISVPNDPILGNSEAYDIAYRTIYDALLENWEIFRESNIKYVDE